MTSSIFTLVIQLVLLIIFQQCVCDVVPTIKLVKWLGTDSNAVVDWVDKDDGIISLAGNVFTVTSDVTALVFQCKAPYPIKWEFEQAKYMLPRENALTVINTRTMRLSKENFQSDPEFFAQLILFGDNRIFNGNYTCHKISQKEIQKNIYLYWEGAATDQSLVLYGRNFTVSSKSQQIVNLPCYVTRPDSEVLLFKMKDRPANFSEFNMEDQWLQLQLNSSIKFDPTKGFFINTAEFSGIIGRYKCQSATEGDFLTIDVVEGEMNEIALSDEIKSNATFIYEVKDETHSKFTCCSNSSDAPELTLYYCDTPVSCEMNRETITSDWGYTIVLQRILKIRKYINGSCISLPRIGGQLADNAVLARCFGDGINIIKQMFFPLIGNASQPYTNWVHAKKEDLVLIQIRNINKTKLENYTLSVFINQSLSFSCKASSYYYSVGSRWVIRYSDGNQTVLPDIVTAQFLATQLNGDLHVIKTDVTIGLGMESISCFAPVWNSTEWVPKTIKFNISTPELKTAEGPAEEHVYWTLNDTDGVLKCQMEGTPVPTIKWRKDGKIIKEYNITQSVSENKIVSSLHIPNITHDIHGEYKCTGKNFAGQIEKTFEVFIEEKKPWAIILVVAFVLFWLFGGIVYFAWRMKTQTKALKTMQSSTYTSSNSISYN